MTIPGPHINTTLERNCLYYLNHGAQHGCWGTSPHCLVPSRSEVLYFLDSNLLP